MRNILNFSIIEDKSNAKQSCKVEYKLKEPWNRLFEIDFVNCGAPVCPLGRSRCDKNEVLGAPD